MGVLYRQCSVLQAGGHVFFECTFFLWREENYSLGACAAGEVPRADEQPALVMRFCVQLLLNWRATTLSSKKPMNVKENK